MLPKSGGQQHIAALLELFPQEDGASLDVVWGGYRLVDAVHAEQAVHLDLQPAIKPLSALRL